MSSSLVILNSLGGYGRLFGLAAMSNLVARPEAPCS